VRTLKRCCIAAVPDTLVVHLKRFRINYDTFLKEKINERLVFGHHLDLFPFTAAGVALAGERARRSRSARDASASER